MDYKKKYEEALNRAKAGKPMDEVFPELKESEDERILKALITHLSIHEGDFTTVGITRLEMLGWLKKLKKQKEQKEQKPINVKYAYPKFRIGDVISPNKINDGLKNIDYTIVGFNERLEDYLVDGGNVPSCSIGIEYIDKNYHIKEQKPTNSEKPKEWSEEDERKRLACIDTINEVIDYERDRWEDYNPGKPYRPITKYDEQIDWLKSLRPQPKQDVLPSLSEKEIICLKRALDYLRKEHNRYGGEDFTNEIVVLEWLITHPILVYSSQPHWKPSEEQMEVLKKSFHCVSEIDEKILQALYDDLKKLM